MKKRIEVLSVETNEGVSKKNGQPYRIVKAHVVLETDEGEKQVGVLGIPRDMVPPAAGLYDAEFGVAVDFQTRDVVGRLVGLVPAKAVSVQKAA